jgi:phosphoribosylpyrophosphate synthetase
MLQQGKSLIAQRSLSVDWWLQGAASVSAYVTHGVFPNATYERFSPQGNGASADGFKYFWITDSCANSAHALRDRPPFEVGA